MEHKRPAIVENATGKNVVVAETIGQVTFNNQGFTLRGRTIVALSILMGLGLAAVGMVMLQTAPKPFWDSGDHQRAIETINAARALTATFHDDTRKPDLGFAQQLTRSIDSLGSLLSHTTLSEEDQLLAYQSLASTLAMDVELSLTPEKKVVENSPDEIQKKINLCKDCVVIARNFYSEPTGRYRPHLVELVEKPDQYGGRISEYLSHAYCVAHAADAKMNPASASSAKNAIQTEMANLRVKEYWSKTKLPRLIEAVIENQEL